MIKRVFASLAVVSAAGSGMLIAAGSGVASAAVTPSASTPGYVRTGLWGPGSPNLVQTPQTGRPGAAQPGAARPRAVSWKPDGAGTMSARLWP